MYAWWDSSLYQRENACHLTSVIETDFIFLNKCSLISDYKMLPWSANQIQIERFPKKRICNMKLHNEDAGSSSFTFKKTTSHFMITNLWKKKEKKMILPGTKIQACPPYFGAHLSIRQNRHCCSFSAWLDALRRKMKGYDPILPHLMLQTVCELASGTPRARPI